MIDPTDTDHGVGLSQIPRVGPMPAPYRLAFALFLRGMPITEIVRVTFGDIDVGEDRDAHLAHEARGSGSPIGINSLIGGSI